MSDNRISLDSYFLQIADIASLRSTCPRARVGAVLVKDGQLVSIGYNGSPSKTDHCIDHGCVIDTWTGSCKRAVHAEINALLQARLPLLHGCFLYCTHRPCLDCTKALINAGITRIVFQKDYRPNALAIEMLEQANVKIEQMEKSDE